MLPKIDSITLKRFNEDAAIKWEDIAVVSKGVVHVFENTKRSGVDVDGLISYARFSYLTISIMSAIFNPLKDKGPYICSFVGFGKNGRLIIENSTLEMLNITGNSFNPTTFLDKPCLKHKMNKRQKQMNGYKNILQKMVSTVLYKRSTLGSTN